MGDPGGAGVHAGKAWYRLRREDIRVDGAKVVVFCIMNKVWGTRMHGRVEPGEVLERLRRVIGYMGGSGGDSCVRGEAHTVH